MAALIVLFLSLPSVVGDWQLQDDALFAVVTHKAGIARGLAHNHLIHAKDFTLEIDGSNIDSLAMRFSLAVEALVVDDPSLTQDWSARIQELGLLDEPYGEVSEKDRQKIRKSMLGKKQLNAAAHPKIEGQLLAITQQFGKWGVVDTEHVIKVRLSLHGESKDVDFRGNLRIDEHHLEVDAVAEVLLSEFGIKPYSAMFGAISNDDEVHFLMHFQAKRL